MSPDSEGLFLCIFFSSVSFGCWPELRCASSSALNFIVLSPKSPNCMLFPISLFHSLSPGSYWDLQLVCPEVFLWNSNGIVLKLPSESVLNNFIKIKNSKRGPKVPCYHSYSELFATIQNYLLSLGKILVTWEYSWSLRNFQQHKDRYEIHKETMRFQTSSPAVDDQSGFLKETECSLIPKEK